MKNNKGLTLIELLAALVVLSIIGLIVIPTVFSQVNEYQAQMYDDQVSIIVDAARSWANDYTERLPSVEGTSHHVTIEELYSGGYLDEDFKNVKTKKPFPATSYVRIRCVLATDFNYNYEYTYITE